MSRWLDGRLRLVAVLGAVAVLVAVPLVATPLQLRSFTQLVVLVVAVLGVNLLTGYTGLISLGHGVFVGVGAIAMAGMVDLGLPLWLGVLAASAITGLVGAIVGSPALRVRGLYLALITFGFALAFPPLMRRMGALTGGVTGRPVDTEFAPPAFLQIDEYAHIWRYGVCLAVVGIWFVLARNLVTSRMGRAMQAVRDDERAAAQFGVKVSSVKIGVLTISTAMAGTAGALQAILFPWISHSQFDVFLSLRIYAAAVLGGLGTLTGALWGVAALIVVPAVNDAVGLVDNDAIVFGAGLILVTLFSPRAR